jgi:hypothetical protein
MGLTLRMYMMQRLEIVAMAGAFLMIGAIVLGAL